jgi:mono/diheme cytochrome c family protein
MDSRRALDVYQRTRRWLKLMMRQDEFSGPFAQQGRLPPGENNMRRVTAAAIALCTIFTASKNAWAWNDEGHAIVALIAEHYLSPAAKDKLQAMLRADSDPLTQHDIASAASWADKYQDSDKKTTRARYNATYEWHFANIQAARPNIPEACFGQPALPPGTPASKGPAKACVIDKINQFWTELADPKTSADERLIALKFVLNLVGDIHQPLRVADEGNGHGALIGVAASSITPGDLFDYWDDAYVVALGPDAKMVAQKLINGRLAEADAHQWASGAPQLWALEAHQLGVDRAYGISGSINDKGQLALPDSDVDKGVKTVALQLSRAGVRLAYILNNALDPVAHPTDIKATAETGNKLAGAAFALDSCSVCHVVSPDQRSPREFTNAPDFKAIANTRGMSGVALREFLFGTHPTMPNMRLSEQQADDVIAFILDLRTR